MRSAIPSIKNPASFAVSRVLEILRNDSSAAYLSTSQIRFGTRPAAGFGEAEVAHATQACLAMRLRLRDPDRRPVCRCYVDAITHRMRKRFNGLSGLRSTYTFGGAVILNINIWMD